MIHSSCASTPTASAHSRARRVRRFVPPLGELDETYQDEQHPDLRH